MLDRRVDPSRMIELSLRDVPLRDALAQIAEELGAGYSQLGPVAYIGPEVAASRLRTIAELRRGEIRTMPGSTAAPLLRMKPWRWDDLATPQELLAALEQEAGLEIGGDDLVPHDLWAAADLPLLTWSDRLTLFAIQFDLTFAASDDGRSVRLIPLPESVAATRTFNVGNQARQLAQRLGTQYPNAEIEIEDDRLEVRGSWEDLEAIASGLAGMPQGRRKATAKKLHTLKLRRARLDQVLKKLEELNLTFDVDEAALQKADIRLDTLVTVDVQNADVDELLKAVLEPVGLTFQRSEGNVRVFPAPSAKPRK